MIREAWSEGDFLSFDDCRIHFRYHKHPEAQNTLVLVHGHGEHSGRYEKFAEYLKDVPLNLATYDVRGHGLSAGVRVYVNSYEDYIQDLSAFVAFLTKHFSLQIPFLLLGHSNGGLTASHWAVRNSEKLKALFLSSPFLGLDIPLPLKIFNDFLNAVNPRLVYKNPVYPPYLTHNLAEVEHYKKDSLIQRKITVRLLSEMIKYQHKLRSLGPVSFNFPVHILMAGLEKVVLPSATKHFFENLKTPEKSLQIFEGFYHEIFNELDQAKVFSALKEKLLKLGDRP